MGTNNFTDIFCILLNSIIFFCQPKNHKSPL
nr:MAG TPA: hypothetical protein [Caudoviricetes sp.]